MRVASRRLRAILAEHRGVFGKSALKAFRRELKNITQSLGSARELDVCIERLEALRPQLHGAPRHALNYVMRSLREKRAVESQYVQACASSVESTAFNQVLMDLFLNLKPSKGCYIKSAEQSLKQQYQALRQLYGLWESAQADEILHRIRICFKKLRYTCELYKPLYGPPMGGFLANLKKAQEELGVWNDYRTLRDYAAELAPGATPRAAEGIPELHRAIETEVNRYLDGFKDSARGFFSYEQADKTVGFLGSAQMPCCQSEKPDPELLDRLY